MSPVPVLRLASASSPPGATASSWVAARPGLCVLQAGLSAWGRGTSRRARHPCHPTAREPGRARGPGGARHCEGGGGRRGRVEGASSRGWPRSRPGARVALRSRSRPPRRKCAPKLPASAPLELDGLGREGGPMAPGEADPAKPHGAGASRCRRCQGPIQVQGAEGEASGNQAPAGALRARAAAQLLPERPGGRGWAPVWGRLNLEA